MGPEFFWGVATSAFQLEGSPHADWTFWDPRINFKPHITHHYRRYQEDLNLLKDLGVNAYRLSIEWSRIQPAREQWDIEAIRHYQKIIDFLRQNDIEPLVTLHHFTHPAWFIKRYPWHNDQSRSMFLRYIEKIALTLKGVRYWITFNEPYVFLLGGYLDGCMPPGIQNISLFIEALKNTLICHKEVYDLIHTSVPDAKIGLVHNMVTFAPCQTMNPFDRILSRIAQSFYNQSLIDAFLTGRLTLKFPLRRTVSIPIPIKGKLDFLGVNYFTRVHLRFNPLKKMGIELIFKDRDGYGLTDTGWEIHPDGLEKVLKEASRLNIPLIITENGIATSNDEIKIRFIRKHIEVLDRCLKKGMDIRGYFYWSLIDSYEWLYGFHARFGLYQVDFDTLERRLTQTALFYTSLVKKNLIF
jgi:beta-glucosidase